MVSDKQLDDILMKLEKMEKQAAQDQAINLVFILWGFTVAILSLYISDKAAVNLYVCIALAIAAVIYTFRAYNTKVPKQ